jgi:hypothetical protein
MVIDSYSLGTKGATGWIETWDDSTSSNKGYLYIQNAYNNDQVLVLGVNSVSLITGGTPPYYYEVGVSYISGTISSAVTGTLFSIDFVRVGDKGESGTVGDAGPTGFTGPTGPQGTTGNGVTGFNVIGDNLYYWFSDWTGTTFGTLQNAGYVRGPTGADGQDGSGGGGGGGTLTYAVFTPFYSEAPGFTFPTLDTRNNIPVLDFDSTNNETTHFRGMIPQGAAFSYLQTNIYWSATEATAGTATWQVAFDNIRTNPDIDSDSFDQGYTGRSYFQGTTSGLPVSIGITCQNVDSLTGGDPFRLRLRRVGSDSLDTLIGDAEFLFFEVRGVT